ncbi:hypothetical protein AB0875_09565 [Micromonospora gifhornensis]|uniref:Uncharacterized protein n=1 Tax=Micromonospora gifhornensis TaxID=84594 RepID=A0ABQ4IG64_9ACTN|nr:hypothetical protein [Micromonospora gifhornensis]GIJ16901.1 hypothetical protein Vgi01_35850 [Micromonospora gifhornensis]
MTADAWAQRDNDLVNMRAAATNYRPLPHAPAGVLIDLRRGELVYHTVPAAQMIEAPQFASLPAVTPELAASPAVALGRPLPEGFRTMDAGTVVVTDRRVVFLGSRGKREWSYAKLVGLLHDGNSPYTLMHVVNRQRISGLYLPSASAPGFRFNLALALADARQQRPALIAQLDGMLAQHRHARPPQPALVTAANAPVTARVPGGVFSIAVVLLFALCAFGGLIQAVSDSTARRVADVSALPDISTAPGPSSSAGGVGENPTPPTAGPTVLATSAVPTGEVESTAAGTNKASVSPTSPRIPSPKPTTARPAPTSSAPRPAPTSASPKPKPTTKAPTPKKVDLCGAPQNPYGYNFCGGSRIYSPAAGVCSYFSCINNFSNGKGYMIECNDGMVSMSGGRPGSCSYHGGNRRTVYR